MNASLDPLYDKLQRDLKDLYDELKDHPDIVLNKKLSDTRWSVLQIMHHLLLSEMGALKYVKKKLSHDPELKKASMMTGFRLLALKMSLRAPFKFKAPAIVGDSHLPEKSTFWEIVKKWNTHRAELKEFLEELPEDLLKKEIFKHPVAGRQTIKGMLQFYEDHFIRHRRQIRKTLKEYHFVV